MTNKEIENYINRWENEPRQIRNEIPHLLALQKKELLEKIENIEIPYGCLQVKEQLEALKKLLT